MQTSVKLQDMMSYSLLLTIIAIAVIVLPLILFAILKFVKFKPKKKDPKAKPAAVKRKYDPVTLRNMYLEKIKEVETRYTTGLIDMRQAHIELSSVVREYCSEASGIPANSLTLKEIEFLNVPSLYNLIKEFYEPEFAPASDKDITLSFRNAREVVNSWK